MTNAFRIVLVGVAVVFAACAVPVPPTGGPEDATPPSIEASEPGSGAVQVQSSRIVLTFTEPIDRTTFARAWSITPDVSGPVDISWNGRRVTLEFATPFRPATTYILTLDTSLRDARRVALGAPVTLAFATGDRLNTGVIAGRVLDPVSGEAVAGMDVFAWPPADTVGTSMPLYRTQTGRDGRFRMTNLRETDYLVAAFQDANRNRRLDTGERFAAPATSSFRADSASGMLPDALYAVQPDTTAPVLQRVRPRTARDLVLRFQEPVVFVADAGTWTVTDSSGSTVGDAVPYRTTDPLEWGARTDSLPPGDWILTGGGALADSAGNRLRPGAWPFTVRGTEPASAPPRVLRVTPEPSALTADGLQPLWASDTLRILLTAPVQADTPPPFSVADTSGGPVSSGAPIRLEPALWTIRPVPDRPFALVTADTTFRFQPPTADRTGELAGVIDAPGPVVLEVYRATGGLLGRVSVPSGLQTFRLVGLPGGATYRIRAFVDQDGNGAWTPGRAHPFRAAEPLLFAEGTDPVRARWESVRADTLRFETLP